MNKVRFGVAGFPKNFFSSSFRKNRVDIFKWLNSIELDHLELQMTYGPKMKDEVANEYGKIAGESGITLSIHASYFIVLTSSDEETIRRSIETLEKTCDLAKLCGADRIVLHPGSGYEDRKKALDNFIINIKLFEKGYNLENIKIFPETSGKIAQIGSFNEIIEICQKVDCCYPCIDFGHLHGRQSSFLPTDDRNKWESVEDFVNSVERLNQELPEKKDFFHYHITPMEYGKQGEIRHRAYNEQTDIKNDQDDIFAQEDFGKPYYPLPEHLAIALKILGVPGIVVSECHDSQDEGAIAMKKEFRSNSYSRKKHEIF